ncbi:MAG TPA: pyridoxamine 5'-phosphate oxidase family protein [Candidatus Saccharimonadales bacterium]|nr:pyridoxamine 5'-phosphate oxidase family protein [Candidatus Saccharimonadales bacterium]
MQPDLQPRIDRAKELLNTVLHAAMATVNADGSPHNTPFFFAHDDSLQHIYWASNPETNHSQNVARTGQIFVVLYDAFGGGGLYLRADNAHATEGDELQRAHQAFEACAARADKPIPPVPHYQGEGPERLYMATIQQLWVNANERGPDGLIIRDKRYEIDREVLQ